MNSTTGVICNNFHHFKTWAKERRIRKFNSNRYIDESGELYYPVYRKDHTRGILFSKLEVAEGCFDNELYHECRLRVKHE